MKKTQQGFTLIELMIVVAIIAILAAIAIPQYQSYVAKSQFTESQTIMDGLKTQIMEYATQNGTCPTNDTTGFGVDTTYAGKYVEKVDLSQNAAGNGTTMPSCKVLATFKDTNISAPLQGKTVTFIGTDNGTAGSNGTYTWACTSDVDNKYLPSTCTVADANP